MTNVALPTYTPKDFGSDQEVRWCPGCGDYAVLKGVQMALQKISAELQVRREEMVFVSGIGCAARFPYYMGTYGLHSIHGRAPAFATGIKLANPDLHVWVVSGDGDLLSIGGNHTMHLMRRNVDINVLLLNNRIYGLTKGQYSPTSEVGKRTKSTPMGSLDYPVNPLSLALGAGCTFVARSLDIDVKHLDALMQRAATHPGTAFIEVYQDCNIFNHKAWFYASQKASRPDATIELEHGKPMIFGANHDRGLVLRGTRIEAVALGEEASASDLLVHDERDLGLAMLLAQMAYPELPEPMGVLYVNPDRAVYDQQVQAQVHEAQSRFETAPSIDDLLHSGETWVVE